ncbi:hypothetical protein [Halopiger aswanensis]|uniref:Phorbol-ester/DAG-type domain-containing protein n=1 Tax=Halopiger aswanensis TaxID=148449 RepID=A0A3R7GYE1_9EURY|nr:hypothetical protein [Halopiger aswanensis]RKD97915.1 hypothetical protein ATJ93_0913 [Halopiger aswanensis]
MKLGTICTTCGERIETDQVTVCETCGRGIHDRCREYETTFECRRCGDEQWIGAVEF